MPAHRYSRRGFLERAGAGALVAGATLTAGGGAFSAGVEDPAASGFGRMFSLPAFAEPTPRLQAALVELGKPGGLLDAHDDLDEGAESLFLERYVSTDENGYRFSGNKKNPSNPTSVAGMTFFAQFIAHDITFDATSPLGHPTSLAKSLNARTARFDLESVYGGGQALAPHLYDAAHPAKLRVEWTGRHADVPRAANGTALVADPRNDQTVILSALHSAFLRFHNTAVDQLGGGLDPQQAFQRARRETRWHYQWLILHEFLPHVAGQDVVDDVLRHGRRFYRPSRDPLVPVEFSAAAFRFAHSMVRPSYRVNFSGFGGKPLFAFTFDPRENGKPVPRDLRGGVRRPAEQFLDWRSFFDFGDKNVGPSKRVDTRISTPLFHLPLSAIPVRQAPIALPQRDLLRQVTWQIPSGQAIARTMGVEAVPPSELKELTSFGVGLERSTPLWYYVLKEAELFQQGFQLGPVGGRIVAEVIVGLLELDPASYLRAKPTWKPTFGGGDFSMVDFMRFAGVDALAA